MLEPEPIPNPPETVPTLSPTAETAQPPANEAHSEKEDTPMLDVHAPHGGMHTWKDFWIHLGTITLGLLIAISLEQSVEWLNHLHQRRQLEADLQAEGVENRATAENVWRVMDDRMAATAARLREVESTLAARRKMDAPFPESSFTPPPHTGANSYSLPLSAVWETAKDSALIDLLPRETARSYTRLYRQVDLLGQLASASDTGESEVTSYECRFSDGTLPCKPVLSQMSDEQLGDYSGLLTRYFGLLQVEKARALIFEFLNDHLLQGLELPATPGTRGADGSGGVGTLSNYRAQHPDTFLRPLPQAGPKP